MGKVTLTVGQIITVSIFLLGTIFTGWSTLNNRYEDTQDLSIKNRERIEAIERRIDVAEKNAEKLSDKADRIYETVADIKVQLEKIRRK